MTNGSLGMYGFASSPFGVTASRETAGCWAGRPDVLKRLRRLMRAFRRADSSLDVVWARLGAGKTHALYHLAHLLGSQENGSVSVPLFVEMPEDIRRFLDLYKRVAVELPTERLAPALADSPSGAVSDELRQAGQVLLHGGPTERRLARDWLIAGRPHLSELRRCTGIGMRIEDDVTATDMLCGIVAALSAQGTRLVLLIDEFQRIGVLRPRAHDAVLSCLRSAFSHCPSHLSVVLAIACQVEQNALGLLPPELTTLLGHRPTISLPEMSHAEATEFVLARFSHFRDEGYSGSDSFPFTREAIEEAVRHLEEHEIALIPRHILQALVWIYDEAEAEGGAAIDVSTAREVLAEMRLDT